MTDHSPLGAPTNPDPRDEGDDLRVSSLDTPDGRPRSRLPAALGGPALRRLWRWTGVMAVVALAAIVIVAIVPHISLPTPRRPPIPYTALAVSEALASCMSGAAWSPDGRRVAAILTPSCQPPDTQTIPSPPDLLLFDAATGKQVAAYDLATATRAALAQDGASASAAAAAFISYYDARWSPDGGLIAVLLSAFGAAGGVTGVALVAVSGAERGHVRALLGDFNATLESPASAFAPFPVDRWDLRDDAHSTVYLTPALAYRWLPDDTLVATEPLGASGAAAPSTEPLGGDPIGGQVFNMWQWGTISPVIATTCGGNGVVVDPLPQPYALLSLATPVWSPDGRYLMFVLAQGRLPTNPGHPAPAASDSSPCDYGSPPDQLPRVPLHDGGLRSALGLLDAHGNTQLTLTWSPDGRRLAVMTDAIALGKGTLLIYDTASGNPIPSFDSSQFEAQVAGYALVTNAVWSPDSRSLLLTIDRPAPRLAILGPAALGG